jgi:metallopeptidase MepB
MLRILHMLCEFTTYIMSRLLTIGRSKVYATDLWVNHFKPDPMDKTVGMRYRQFVLQPGGSQPELKSLSNFLGREPSDKAYYSEVTSTPGSETTPKASVL